MNSPVCFFYTCKQVFKAHSHVESPIDCIKYGVSIFTARFRHVDVIMPFACARATCTYGHFRPPFPLNLSVFRTHWVGNVRIFVVNSAYAQLTPKLLFFLFGPLLYVIILIFAPQMTSLIFHPLSTSSARAMNMYSVVAVTINMLKNRLTKT